MNDRDINYTREAFLHPWNLTFLIAAMLTAFVMGGGFLFNLVLLIAAAAELMYLGVVPRDPRFQRVIRSQKAAERSKAPSQKEIFNLLGRQNQRRYVRLRRLEKEIRSNYEKLSYASQGLLDSHLKKIDGLLDSYLNLLYQRERYEVAMQQSTQSEVSAAIAALKDDMADDPPRVKSIKERRLRILLNRLERFKKGRENIDIIDAQLATVEDVTQYIHEQSLTLRNPEEITFQLDTLLSEVEETEKAVQEVEDVFAPGSDIAGIGTGSLLDGLDDTLNDITGDLSDAEALRQPRQKSRG